MRRTPLAWKNLTQDPRRLGVAIGGVAFAVLLMFMELGFLNALLDSNVKILEEIRGDLIIVNRAKYAQVSRERFPAHRIRQAQACPHVRVFPLYIESTTAVLRHGEGKSLPIRIIAFDPSDDIFTAPGFATQRDALRQRDVALVDSATHRDFGIPKSDQDLRTFQAELNLREIHFIGRFSLCTDFANDGNLLMSSANLARFFPQRLPGADPLSAVDLGVVQVQESEISIADARTKLEGLLPEDVRVLTKSDYVALERDFWRTSTPVGYIFVTGTILGFVVGIIICYQIIYADVADHLSEFATLKAMGYGNAYFLRLMLAESVYLSFLGFFPGAVVSWGIYRLLGGTTGLLLIFRADVAAIVLLATILMCTASGLLVLRKLMRADPAELF